MNDRIFILFFAHLDVIDLQSGRAACFTAHSTKVAIYTLPPRARLFSFNVYSQSFIDF